MRRILYIMTCSFFAVFSAHAQETPKESEKILNVKLKGKPAKEERKPEFNKDDSSFNKKLSRKKRKEISAKRKRAKTNAKIREMEVHNNKRNVEFARKMEQRERLSRR